MSGSSSCLFCVGYCLCLYGGSVTKHKAKRDHLADIYRLVLDLSDRNGRVRKSEAEKVVTQRGYNIDQFQDCLDEYSANNIWQLTTDSIVILDI